MSSIAHQNFTAAVGTISLLCQPGRMHSLAAEQRRLQYHASLAMYVAAWQVYVESAAREFLASITSPLDIQFSAVHVLLSDRIGAELKRFNTPNWENARTLLIAATGYDPINDWSWPRRHFGGIAFRTLINEILQVRHSFAHGYPMPSYSWNTDNQGRPRLTLEAMALVRGAFVHIAATTDRGLSGIIGSTYGLTKAWY